MFKTGAARRAALIICTTIPALIIWQHMESGSPGALFWSGKRIFLIVLLGVIFISYVIGITSRAFSVAISVTAVFVWWFATNQDWSEIGANIRQADMSCIMLALVPSAVFCILRVLRWQIMMRPVKALSFAQSLGATLIALTGNNILPLRAGEFIRPAIIKMRYSGSFTATFTTIVVERLLDLIGLGVVLIFTCIFWPVPSSNEAQNTLNISQASLLLIGMIAVPLGCLILLKKHPESAKGAVAWLMRMFPGQARQRILRLIDSFVAGFAFAENTRHVLMTLICSIAMWAASAASFYYCARAFDFHMSFIGACFVLLSTSLAAALPQAPSFIGTFHWAATLAARMLQMPEAAAASFAIISHAIVFIPVTIAGFISLWVMGLTLGQVTRKAQKTESIKDHSS